jgi:hypothetical protein
MLLGTPAARAADLTIAAYIELSLARLQLAKDTWEREQQAPSVDAEEALYQQYGITVVAYYAFAGAHRQEIEGYLAAHPEVQVQIDSLSERLHELIEQTERR